MGKFEQPHVHYFQGLNPINFYRTYPSDYKYTVHQIGSNS